MLHSFPASLGRVSANIFLASALILSSFSSLSSLSLLAQEKTVWSDQEKPIVEQIRSLRKLDDTVRAPLRIWRCRSGNCPAFPTNCG